MKCQRSQIDGKVSFRNSLVRWLAVIPVISLVILVSCYLTFAGIEDDLALFRSAPQQRSLRIRIADPAVDKRHANAVIFANGVRLHPMPPRRFE
jgi:hypothetical protein